MFSKKLILTALILALPVASEAAWQDISGDLPEKNLCDVMAKASPEPCLYAASARALYKSEDSGRHWKKIKSARSRRPLRSIGPGAGEDVFAASSREVFYSKDAGRTWKPVYKTPPETEILSASHDRWSGGTWVSTSSGLILCDVDGKSKILEFANERVYEVLPMGGKSILAATERGLYESDDRISWRLVYASTRPDVQAQNDSSSGLEQFGAETVSLRADWSAFSAAGDRCWVLGPGGLLGKISGSDWREISILETSDMTSLSASARCLYISTERGLFRFHPEKGDCVDISKELGVSSVKRVRCSFSEDRLFAVGEKGIFCWSHPEADLQIVAPEASRKSAHEILAFFADEPSVSDVQKAAMRYADVQPDKIIQWKNAAALKAWLPSFSINTDCGVNQNIDLDRGGTGDPDRFITGPEEKQWDWSVGVSWDLGELVWNPDQTQIDTRSRLTTELRGGLMHEVTQLYFARRRLQVEMALSPVSDVSVQSEKIIRLEELTAALDGLTSHYFSDACRSACRAQTRKT